MPFEKGHTKARGRVAGSKNKATQSAREAIARFVDNNSERLQGWLEKVAKDNPEKAFAMFQSMVEYHIPKLQRSTIEGDPDKPINHSITVNYVGE